MACKVASLENSNQHQSTPDQGAVFIKELTNLDCAIFDPSQGIVGQSWHVDVVVHGALNDLGFVYDFSHLKSLVRQSLKDSIDHALVIPVGSKNVDFTEGDNGECWKLHARCRINNNNCHWEYDCPKGAVYPIRCTTITTKAISQEINRLMRHRLPDTVSKVEVQLREEDSEPTEAFFRYTHGISGHEGLCQRLFHGHRSRIEVFVDEERRADLEHYVARDLFGNGIHVVTPSQVLNQGSLEIGSRGTTNDPIDLSYTSTLGTYSAKIPANQIFVVENETSIECISRQLALTIKKKEGGNSRIKVQVYEGIRKGAITEL